VKVASINQRFGSSSFASSLLLGIKQAANWHENILVITSLVIMARFTASMIGLKCQPFCTARKRPLKLAFDATCGII
jgi:hypothetical protein